MRKKHDLIYLFVFVMMLTIVVFKNQNCDNLSSIYIYSQKDTLNTTNETSLKWLTAYSCDSFTKD